MSAAQAQQRLAGAAAAAARRWMSSSLTPRRTASSHGHFQVRNSSNMASPAQPTASNGADKSLSNALEFVKNVRDIFSMGTAERELNTVKDLSTTVFKLEERGKTLSTQFWVLVAMLVPSCIAIKSSQDSQKAELKRLGADKVKAESNSKAMENRILALEYANLYAEKYAKESVPIKAPSLSGPPEKVNGDNPSLPDKIGHD